MANTRCVKILHVHNIIIKYYTGSKAYEKLSDVILSRQLHKDMENLSLTYQTSSLEAYHSVLNHFAPKLLAFSYTRNILQVWL